jgi:hypothetical protein
MRLLFKTGINLRRGTEMRKMIDKMNQGRHQQFFKFRSQS